MAAVRVSAYLLSARRREEPPKTQPSLRARWGVSPHLMGPAVAQGLPTGVGKAYDSDVIANVSPTILSLSRLITDATGSPLSIVVGSRLTPWAFSSDLGPGDYGRQSRSRLIRVRSCTSTAET